MKKYARGNWVIYTCLLMPASLFIFFYYFSFAGIVYLETRDERNLVRNFLELFFIRKHISEYRFNSANLIEEI